MLYGCTGYSGKLIAKECKRQGLSPILAGRSEAKVKTVAEQYGVEYRVFDLNDADRLEKSIADCYLVFNTAGPFTSTCIPLLNACLNKKVYNLSLVGEQPFWARSNGKLIENTDMFAAASRMDVILMSVIMAMRPIIKIKAVQNWLNKMIDRLSQVPAMRYWRTPLCIYLAKLRMPQEKVYVCKPEPHRANLSWRRLRD